MIRTALLLSFAVAAGVAHGDASTDRPGLFGDAPLHYVTRDPSAVRQAANRVVGACAFSMLSRIGPSPDSRRQCEKAAAAAIAYGSDGAQAALETIDANAIPPSARYRLYDVVARVADPQTVEPLVAALEKLDQPRFEIRRFEVSSIVATLRTITFAAIGEERPFEGYRELEPRAMATAWRAWFTIHKGRTRAELLDGRIAEARAAIADPDLAAAFQAARFLVAQLATHDDGVAAMKQLATRDGIPATTRSEIQRAAMQPAAAPLALGASDRRV